MGLFSTENKNIEHGSVDTIIGAKARFKGELLSAGAVHVNGEFYGRIEAKGDVIVSRGSKIIGDVVGGNVVVSGRVEGNISAGHNLEISRSGRVNGDLSGGKIIIEEGSSYYGKVKVNQEAESPAEEIVEIVESAQVQAV
ncbi:MAG: polymer-forming cytoskeletal protein [bacterium]|nr:polymer-forming cytoskeletal protein [Candidatus Margulisiibacteriota bacterium]